MVPVCASAVREDDAGEVLEVDLVADAHAGRDGGEVVEGGLAPLEEGVALAVALELEGGVRVVGVGGAEFVDLDGVVDDELGGLERVDLVGVAAEGAHGVAHGGEVDDCGHAGEILHEDAGGHVGDLAGGLGGGVPLGEELDVVGGDGAAVFVAEEVFKQDAEGEGDLGEVVLFERGEGEVGDGLAAGGEGGLGLEGVGMGGDVHGVLGRGGAEWGRWAAGMMSGEGYQAASGLGDGLGVAAAVGTSEAEALGAGAAGVAGVHSTGHGVILCRRDEGWKAIRKMAVGQWDFIVRSRGRLLCR